MIRRWVIIMFIFLLISFLIWGGTRRGIAQDERFWPMKILSKLDTILENQNLILKEIKALKDL